MTDPVTAATRVMLVGDCPLVRSGFRQILETAPGISVVASVADAREAVAFLRQGDIDVVITGGAMRQTSIRDAREILECRPGARVLVLGQSVAARVVRAALVAGARGYVSLNGAHEAELIDAVRVIAGGDVYLSPDLPRLQRVKPANSTDEGGPCDRLTKREKQVLALVAAGRSSREIATMLGMSTNTVAVHRANMMKALAIRKVAGLVLFAVRHGLVTAD